MRLLLREYKEAFDLDLDVSNLAKKAKICILLEYNSIKEIKIRF